MCCPAGEMNYLLQLNELRIAYEKQSEETIGTV